MASGAGNSATFFLLLVNLVLYLIITIIASWAINHGIDDTHKKGVVGFTTSATGINNVAQWKASSLYAASASALITWSLTLLAMGFACKEIDIGWSGSTLRALEVILIIVSGTQFLSMVTIQAGIEELSRYGGGRV
uniref:AWPM-19-like family protein n=1 Tax=Tanacetum cinerariifolium TaxID=118510 RepID=A0A6L2LGF2_TANCI|nr:AWPM-19-like family protein [Tanacetum cinerariifolium]